MGAFEAALDPCGLPGVWMVARLEGRNFTRLTKQIHPLDAPFDSRFHDFMIQTDEELMSGCGLKVVYSFTRSDELSLPFGPDEGGFGRRLGGPMSVRSGEASARFSLLLGEPTVLDGRVSPPPREEFFIDDFRWRAEDALRNARTAHCDWLLR